MRAHPRSIAVVIAGLAAACAAAPQRPVPLAGTVGDLAALTGH